MTGKTTSESEVGGGLSEQMMYKLSSEHECGSQVCEDLGRGMNMWQDCNIGVSFPSVEKRGDRCLRSILSAEEMAEVAENV